MTLEQPGATIRSRLPMSRPPAMQRTCPSRRTALRRSPAPLRWVTACVAIWGLLAVAADSAVAADTSSDADTSDTTHDPGVRAPADFEVTLYAGDDLAHDIHSLTLDAQGRVVVSGPGYIKTLHDDDQDGRADRAVAFANRPTSGARGMCFDGPDLIFTGDNGLMRWRDIDGDGQADGSPELWAQLRNPEHGANGIQRGPDGWFYVICGNDAGVAAELAGTLASPVTTPECGAVLRFSPDGRESEIVAHGFRNPYDLAFSVEGAMLTVDSDGERDQHLPWYAPTRLFDVATGQHHGWVQQGWQRSWSRPPWYFDSVERLLEIGRGSPTGVVVYRHRQFPLTHRGGVFSCCWTLGRVYFFPLHRESATYGSRSEVFLESVGDEGFAPVDLAVGAAGELYIAAGGRRTQGSVYRVRYRGPTPVPTRTSSAVADVLSADEPLSAWSRAQWVPVAKQLGATAFVQAALKSSLDARQRIRAIEILTELFGGLPADTMHEVVAEPDAEVAARLAWSLGRVHYESDRFETLAKLTWSESPLVQRAAWEALAASAPHREPLAGANWGAIEQHPERRVRAAALLADLRHRGDGRPVEPPEGSTSTLLALLWRLHLRGQLRPNHAETAARAFTAASDPDQRIEAIRLMELAWGDIELESDTRGQLPGYSLHAHREAAARLGRTRAADLLPALAAGQPELAIETARLCALMQLEDATAHALLAARWTDNSPVTDDLHYLMVLAQLPGPRSANITLATARALVRLPAKMQSQQRFASRNWPLRLAEAFEHLVARDGQLAEAVIGMPDFGLPQHSLYVMHMPETTRQAAARQLLRRLDERRHEWSEECVAVAAVLPRSEALPELRKQWSDYRLQDEITRELARFPALEDRERLVIGLAAPEPDVVEAAARALASLPVQPRVEELGAAVRALRVYATLPAYDSVRQSLLSLIRTWAGDALAETASPDESAADESQRIWAWFQRFAPEAADQIRGFGEDTTAWNRRLARLPWETGLAERGKAVFQRRACHRCHAGTGPLGPDLAGAAQRMSRLDLFAHILDPSKEVSPLYQTTRVVTASGRTLVGLIVYESPESTLVQTSSDTVVRVAGDEIIASSRINVSLMPAGLLADATDQELCDLYAYLQTLRGKQ